MQSEKQQALKYPTINIATSGNTTADNLIKTIKSKYSESISLCIPQTCRRKLDMLLYAGTIDCEEWLKTYERALTEETNSCLIEINPTKTIYSSMQVHTGETFALVGVLSNRGK